MQLRQAGVGEGSGHRTLAAELADLALRTSLADVPAPVVERAKIHLLDQLGAQIVGSTLPTVAAVTRYAFRYGGEGPSTVVGTGRQMDAELASLVNATTGHAFEMDDYAVRAGTHPGCEVVPAVLAVAEEVDASGAELLRAVVLGFEAVTRVGLVTMPSMLADRGFHESCPHGVVASALAVGLLQSLSVDKLVMALAIAVSHASGTTEYAHSGGEVKRVHAGLGAIGAIRSVRLAEAGLTGPPTILEGERGFFKVFTERYDADLLTAGWGERWEFLRYGALKSDFCVASIHPHLQALRDLRGSHNFSVADVEEIILGVDPRTRGHGSSVGPDPTDIVGAQFSGQFSVALNLVRGSNGLEAYEWAASRKFKDPEISHIAHRVRIVGDPECAGSGPEAKPGKLGKVELRLKDGEVLTARAYGKGSPANPMTRDEVEEKYYALAARRVSKGRAKAIVDAVQRLETLPKTRELGALLRVT